MLGRLGSQPGSGDQHHSGQCQLPGPSQGVDNQGQKLVQKQGQLPTRSQGAGSGGGGEGGRGDEHEALTRAAGLEQDAEEELRGLSRLEEDALEAKVAGPIGQSPFTYGLVLIALITPIRLSLWRRTTDHPGVCVAMSGPSLLCVACC